MLHLCAINMLLWQFFSSMRGSHYCQQCCFASPLQVIKVLLSVCVYTQAPVSAVLAKVVWRSRNYCLLMCPYPGSDVVHRSADAAGQPLQDRADPSANYQSHPSWQQRQQRRYQERQWWRPEQLHTWRLESLKHICLSCVNKSSHLEKGVRVVVEYLPNIKMFCFFCLLFFGEWTFWRRDCVRTDLFNYKGCKTSAFAQKLTFAKRFLAWQQPVTH